ncbi:MAG: phage holin family protein [Bacilli bacterium]|nr:phage holin family protein [Bacilli bacterium]
MKKTELMTSSAIVSVFTFLVGGFDSLLVSLLIIMGLDFLTGICKAIYKKELNSTIGVKGILKKFGYLLIVILATLFDRLISDGSMAIRTLVIYFFIANEAISILENWGALGLPLPKKLYDVFEKLKNEENNVKK